MPGHGRYYRYQFDATIDGKAFSVDQYFKCYQQADFSEGDMRFHSKWYAAGAGVTAAQAAPGKVLLLDVRGHCLDTAEELPRSASLLLGAPAIDSLAEIDGALADQGIAIVRISSTPVAQAPRALGPSAAQAALKKSLMQSLPRMQRVYALTVPERVWTATPQSAAFADGLTRLTAASPDMQHGGYYDVAFPYAQQRRYQAEDVDPARRAPPRPLGYRDGVFRYPPAGGASLLNWYPMAAGAAEQAEVDYQGLRLQLRGGWEIYDPRTRELVLLARLTMLAPWGPPDGEDVIIGPAAGN